MGFRIMHNIGAMNANRNLGRSEGMMRKSLEKLSSGFRINSAADDAAGLGASQRMRAEIASLKVATRNATEATSLLQVAEGGMEQVGDILQRLKELATQAASGNAGVDRSKIATEASQLMTEVDRIANFLDYNGVKLLNGSFGAVNVSTHSATLDEGNGIVNIDVTSALPNDTLTLTAIADVTNTIQFTSTASGVAQQLSYSAVAEFQTSVLDFSNLGLKVTINKAFTDGGDANLVVADTIRTTALGDAQFQVGYKGTSDANHRLGFKINDMRVGALNGGAALSVDLSTATGAQDALDDIQTAIDYVSTQRSNVGSYINRFGYTVSNLNISVENKQSSESVIRDADMAMEMTDFTRNQILVQAGTAMLAQANVAPQSVLSLLQ